MTSPVASSSGAVPAVTPVTGPAAAVDLGSNSFHMVIARVDEHDLRIVDRIREPVQLAMGLDEREHLSEDAQARALECLSRFGQRLRDMPATSVRAVGTNTLRKAKNARAFLARAQKALGHRVEIVSGTEEARLIYLGVAHSLSDDEGRRLVVDIGGGSTECILGERFEPLRADSLHMGCVSWSKRFFPDGRLRREAFKEAELAARLELQTIERRFRNLGWEAAVGASGTVVTIAEIVRQQGWAEQGITRASLRKLRKALVGAEAVGKLALPTLKPERAAVLPGGLAILSAIFDALEVEELRPSTGALREGVLYDLLGRIRHEDVRDRTIRRFVERFNVDQEQAARVERTAVALHRQVRAAWGLGSPDVRHFLEWGARLHEIGLAVTYSSYQKHGAYLVQHADMPGFSNDDKHVLATLVLGHRRKLLRPVASEPLTWSDEALLRMVVLLRLAVLLNRSRSPRTLPALEVRPTKTGLALAFPPGWLEEHPLTVADLAQERPLLAAAGVTLDVE